MSSYARYNRTVSMTEGDFLKRAIEDIGFKSEKSADGKKYTVKDANNSVVGDFTFTGKSAEYQHRTYDDVQVSGTTGLSFNTAESFLNAVIGSYNMVEADVQLLERGYQVIDRTVTKSGIELRMGGH